MSLDTRGRDSRPTRPETNRLPRAPGRPAERGREIRVGLLGVLGILLLVAGIPAALVVFVGYPLPRSAPSHDWLTQSITATLIIKILACVVWLVWAHFTACVIAEWRALRHGRLPSDLPFGGGSQQIARRLVAAALLLSGAATIAHSFTGVTAPRTAPPVASQVHATQPTQQPAAESAAAGEQKQTGTQPIKYYVVRPPHGRRYDCLWDIAERTLGDARRYHEIFALNKDRMQADGRRLVDANLIMPGWELRLPGDATGPGVRHAPAAHHHQPGHPPQQDAAGAVHRAVANRQGASRDAADPDVIPGVPIGGGLLLAGVLVALAARRGPYGEVSDDVATLADPGVAARLDRQLRALAAARAAQGRELPAPVVAFVDPERVRLVLAGGDTADPPEPWRLASDHDWLLDPAADAEPAANAAAPFPALLALGRHDEHGPEVFADLEQAPGVIALTGAVEPAREFAAALAVHAATCVWSDGAQVTMVGFADRDELTPFAPNAIRYVDRLADVLDSVEERHAAATRLQHQLGVRGVLSGRQRRPDDAWRPHLLVLSGPPAADEFARLEALVAGRSNVIAVMLGDAATPWRFVMHPDGRLDLGALGTTVRAHRLTAASRRRFAEELDVAGRRRPVQTAEVAALTPAAAVADLPAGNRRPRNVPVVAEVSLLGPVTVTASGPLPDGQREQATEIAVAVALHPDGIHDAVLRASIWPRGVSDDVFAAAMQTTAGWLGAGPGGVPSLAADPDGRWRLGAGVRVDWDDLRTSAASAAGERELVTLTEALELIRGEAFSATPAGRYRWLAFARATRDARVVATAVARRASALLVAAHRNTEAADVLRRGLRLVPTSELLWRELLTITSWDGPDAPMAVAAEMYATLKLHRVWPEAQTDALVAQVAPRYGSEVTLAR